MKFLVHVPKFILQTSIINIIIVAICSAEDVISSIYPSWDYTQYLMGIPERGTFVRALPIVDGDVIPEPIFDYWEAGKGINVPTIVG